MIIIGAIIGTAANGAGGDVNGLFWCLTIARGIIGVVSTLYTSWSSMLKVDVRVQEESTPLPLPVLAKQPTKKF